VYTVNPDGVVLLVSGEKITVQFSDILQSDADFKNLTGRELEITLKDNSVMRGKVRNYDADIGLLVEIDLGVITVPPDNIKSIMDYTERGRQRANFVQIGLLAGYYFMIGDLSGVFSGNVTGGVFSEFNLGAVFEGLFAGALLSYHNLNVLDYSGYAYYLFKLDAYVMYRFLMLRTAPGALRNLVPFATLGAGAAFPIQTANGETALEVDVSLTGSVGLDYFVGADILIRLAGMWTTILQSRLPFHSLSVNFGAAYCF